MRSSYATALRSFSGLKRLSDSPACVHAPSITAANLEWLRAQRRAKAKAVTPTQWAAAFRRPSGGAQVRPFQRPVHVVGETAQGRSVSRTFWVQFDAHWPTRVDIDEIAPIADTPLDAEAIAQLRKWWEAAIV